MRKKKFGICLDCGGEISFNSKRCHSCANRNRAGSFGWNIGSKVRRMGEGNPNWKGEKVQYAALHDYIKWHKSKPLFCEKCKQKRRLDLSNISGRYKRDLSDWQWLCRSCHVKYDYDTGIRIHYRWGGKN